MKSVKITNNIYAHIFLHKISKSMEEIILESEEFAIPDYDKIAEEYIDALDENYCVAFLESLHKVSARKIIEHWKEFSPDQLKNKHYKQYLKFKE